MHPVIFKVGPFILFSFSLFLAIGLCLGCFVVWKYGREEHSEDKLFDSVLISFILALFFSRLFYVISHFDFFGLDVLKWLLFMHYPGFSFWGAFMGAVIGLFFTARSKILVKKFFDLFSLGLSILMVFGDIGCFLGGCMVGSPARLSWAVVVPGFEQMRHPLSLYFLIVDIIILVLLFKVFNYLKENSKNLMIIKDGLTGLFYLSAFFISRGIFEFYKERSEKIVGEVLIITGFIFLIIFYKKIGRSFREDFKKFFKSKNNSLFILFDSLNIPKKENENGQHNAW